MRLRLRSKKASIGKQASYASSLSKDWRDSIPNRPSRPRRRANGRLVPVKNPASRTNALGRSVIRVKHAGESRTLRLGRFDLRRTEGRKYRAVVTALTQHLGGPEEITEPQRQLIDQAARLAIISGLAWDQLERGAFRKGESVPALQTYKSVIADIRSILSMLGLERRAKAIPNLHDYLATKTHKRLPLKDVSDAEEVE